jgi:hypothetical protein
MKKWIKENVFREVPIIGVFLKGMSRAKACRQAAKMTCEMTGSIVGMVIFMNNVPMPSEEHTNTSYYAKMAASMGLGNMIGAITFNTLSSVIKITQSVRSFWHFISQESASTTEHHRSDQENVEFGIQSKK